jgi:hypothetical protein
VTFIEQRYAGIGCGLRAMPLRVYCFADDFVLIIASSQTIARWFSIIDFNISLVCFIVRRHKKLHDEKIQEE